MSAAMMADRHYDDEALISLMETGRAGSDGHLPACKTCSEKLQSFRGLSDHLHDASVWDCKLLNEDPVPSTIANLRAFADRMTAEDTRAEAYLNDLLAGSREEWMPRLQQHPEYRTAGVVRKLIAASDRAIDTMPPDAVEISRIATEIADHLDPSAYPSDAVARLRGAAWRDRGYVLTYVGDYVPAMGAITRAEAAFQSCVVGDYEQARLNVLRSLVERRREEFEAAARHSREASVAFATFGDTARVASSRLAEGLVLSESGRYEDALIVWQELRAEFPSDDTSDVYGRVMSNIGYVQHLLGRVDEAIQSFQIAADVYDLRGVKTEATRVRLNIAAMLLENGRLEDAGKRFVTLIEEFNDLGMESAAAITMLQLAEVRLFQERHAEVRQLCAAAMQQFLRSGLAYSQRAMTAMSYAREAAEAGTATPQLIRHVREYVRRLPSEPALLFMPPPA